MQILVNKTSESVIFSLPNGTDIEITMVNVYGEDVAAQNDVNEAFRILRDDLHYFDCTLSHWRWNSPPETIDKTNLPVSGL